MKKKLLIGLFLLLLFTVPIAGALLPDEAVSYSERRKLSQWPSITLTGVFDGSWTKDLEEYLLDQFPLRDQLRSIISLFRFHVLHQSDSNDIYLYEDQVYKLDYPLDETSVQRFASKVNGLIESYFTDAQVYWALIPDKTAYLEESSGYLRLDYPRMYELLVADINAQGIDLYDVLDTDAYYRTDLHWRQERLTPVVERLEEAMKFTVENKGMIEHQYAPFYGAYYGQAALPIQADDLIYLTSEVLDQAIVTDLTSPQLTAVYNEAALGKVDSYDVFLHGAAPLITIENPQNPDGKTLVIFRDSFASSLAPLLLEGYSKITLVDLRYLSSTLLTEYVDMNADDVLFLYGMQVINNSNMLQ